MNDAGSNKNLSLAATTSSFSELNEWRYHSMHSMLLLVLDRLPE